MANVPISNLTTTWNNVSTTFTGIKLNVTDTASAAGSLLMDLQVGGTSRFNVAKNGAASARNVAISDIDGVSGPIEWRLRVGVAATVTLFSETLSLQTSGRFAWGGGSPDLFLVRDAANTLAQRNSVNAQTFRLYNTFTDASNYERLSVSYVSNIARIETSQAGTGASRLLLLRGDQLFLRAGSNGNGVGWQVDASGNLMTSSDNAIDIGATADTRPRNLFLGSYMQYSEMTAPAAPAANGVRIFAQDNGAGKTQLMALFATGTAIPIATEL